MKKIYNFLFKNINGGTVPIGILIIFAIALITALLLRKNNII